uniref:Uncharacterized protein n=1 Tax=Ciona savignyi TaxID=51511 RepID=H2ZIK4_CIOSA
MDLRRRKNGSLFVNVIVIIISPSIDIIFPFIDIIFSSIDILFSSIDISIDIIFPCAFRLVAFQSIFRETSKSA